VKSRRFIIGVFLLVFCSAAAEVGAQRELRRSIAWYGTWESGLAAAKESGRPILLVSAAPHCHQVPGMW